MSIGQRGARGPAPRKTRRGRGGGQNSQNSRQLRSQSEGTSRSDDNTVRSFTGGWDMYGSSVERGGGGDFQVHRTDESEWSRDEIRVRGDTRDHKNTRILILWPYNQAVNGLFTPQRLLIDRATEIATHSRLARSIRHATVLASRPAVLP